MYVCMYVLVCTHIRSGLQLEFLTRNTLAVASSKNSSIAAAAAAGGLRQEVDDHLSW